MVKPLAIRGKRKNNIGTLPLDWLLYTEKKKCVPKIRKIRWKSLVEGKWLKADQSSFRPHVGNRMQYQAARRMSSQALSLTCWQIAQVVARSLHACYKSQYFFTRFVYKSQQVVIVPGGCCCIVWPCYKLFWGTTVCKARWELMHESCKLAFVLLPLHVMDLNQFKVGQSERKFMTVAVKLKQILQLIHFIHQVILV